MKHVLRMTALCLGALAGLARADDAIPVHEITATMRKACDYQLEQQAKGKADNGWIRGAFYTGVMAAYRATQDEHYLDAAMKWAAEQGDFTPQGKDLRFADNQCCGQTYLELYLLKRDPKMIEPTRRIVDEMIEHPRPGRAEWWWCDALFMAPPMLARLATATGDDKYLKFLDQMWWDSTEFLFDKEVGLYYRDKSFFNGKTKNGQKIFWSRGNGWVAAGTCRVLEHMPADWPTREKYAKLHQRMMAVLVKLQGEDGLWRPSLLDAEEFPMPETSGTAFYCYAMAWGINHGTLDRETYLPLARKAWRGLAGKVTEEGKLGYVQRVAGAPGAVKAEDTHEYAVGGLLLAGSEMMKMEGHGH
jgi:rhamnogalacturonyl hydrolase YesR